MPSRGWRASRTSAISCGLLALAARTTARRRQGDLRLFLHRRENDRRVRARHARDPAERLGDQLVQAGSVARDHLEQVRVQPRHAMALEDFVDLDNLPDEYI